VRAQVLAQYAVLGAEEMLEEIFVPLPDAPSRLERQTNRLRGQLLDCRVVAGELQLARLQRLRDVILRLQARRGGLLGDSSGLV